ncbi:family 78 glycoside hydrolase catalytic domain [Nibricoccus sp. IMCC34717]|uniref:family 78 glycoside hydrolase catalytic domain n=1 Tax=Nibricoccus sp. IMCC34717 TaxID=3034021 RepID=UPI00384C1E90
MNPFVRLFCLLCTVVAIAISPGQAAAPAPLAPTPSLLDQPWEAQWIAPPGESGRDYGVYQFRRDFSLTEKPARFVVHVSADNRYRLFINGHSIGVGPARGDLAHWRFETYDLAPYLRTGENTVAALVWNSGEETALAQHSARTALIVQDDNRSVSIATTGPAWRVRRVAAYTPAKIDHKALATYLVTGPGDQIDGRMLDWDWQTTPLSGSGWSEVRQIERGFPHGTGTGTYWQLVPRNIPMPEETPIRLARIRKSTTPIPEGFLLGNAPWSLPPRSTAKVLIDAGALTTAYPELEVSGGRGATLRLTYAEALFDAQRNKGNRNEVEGKTLIGIYDEFISDGGANRVFSTLWYRAFRFVELQITTADEALTVRDLRARFTGYPFEERGSFSSDDASLKPIWEIGWRTARLCAFETYMDCPYYEQLQYVGDTRIQALISLYVSGDDRLVRNAIQQYNDSRIPEGLTQSRYPSAVPQVINTFSLFWIDMVHDYWRHRDDPAFVANQLAGVDSVLGWFGKRLDAKTGLLGPLEYWTFVDWPDAWPWDHSQSIGGVPPGAREGGSTIVTLQYAITLGNAAELYSAFGRAADAARCREIRAGLLRAVREKCWDSERRYFSDTPDRKSYSQHANTFAVLAGAVAGDEARDLITRTASDATLIPCTQYFRFYLLRAMRAAGLGERYLSELGPWRNMVALGLTTFAERQDPTRSDCHAWSASPNYELLATVCGIEPGAPGFRRVHIEPRPGPLNRLEGRVPHPLGDIVLVLKREGASGSAEVTLPRGLAGDFVWAGRTYPLHEGSQTLRW